MVIYYLLSDVRQGKGFGMAGRGGAHTRVGLSERKWESALANGERTK